MATYIQGVTDVTTDPINFSPNVGLMSAFLEKKGQQYEQGHAAIQSAYDKIANLPLTNGTSVAVRDQYIKQAQEKLKGMVGQDFSDLSVVDEADKVFSPFWEDKRLLLDYSKTKNYQTELGKYNNLANSTKMEDREQANGIVYKYLQNGMDQLKNASFDEASLSSVEDRKFVPWVNVQKYLNEQASKMPDNLSIKWSSANGPYLYNQTNGARSVINFQNWAAGQIGDNLYQQFYTQGVVEKEESLKNIKKFNPGISDQDALKFLATDVVTKTEKGYSGQLQSISDELASLKAKYDLLPTTLIPGSAEAAQAAEIEQRKIELEEQRTGVDKQYSDFKLKDKDELYNDVVRQPNEYYAQLAKNNTIKNWAVSRASDTDVEIKLNEPWVKMQDLKNKNRELDIAQQNANTAQFKAENDDTGTSSKSSKSKKFDVDTDGDGVMDANAEALRLAQNGRYVGPGYSDITKQGNVYEVFNERLNNLDRQHLNTLIDVEGPISLLSTLPGVDPELVSKVRTVLQSNYDNLSTKGQYNNSDDLKTIKEFSAVMAKNGYGLKSLGPNGVLEGIVNYAKTYLKDKKDKNLSYTDSEKKAITNIVFADKMRAEYISLSTERNRLINDLILNRKDAKGNKLYPNLIVNRDGKQDLVTAEDIAKNLPTIEVYDNDAKKNVTISKKELADLFVAGKLEQSSGGDVVINDKVYQIQKTNNAVGFYDATRAYNSIVSDVNKKYGTSKDFYNTYKKALGEIVPDLPYFNTQTGKYGTKRMYDFNSKTQGETAVQITNEALNVGSTRNMYDSNDKPVSNEILEAVQALGRMGDDMEDYLNPVTVYDQGVNGNVTVEFSFKPTKDKPAGDVKLAGDITLADLIANGPVRLEIPKESFNAKNFPQLSKMTMNTGTYVFNSLLRGESYKADAGVKSLGFDFSIIPEYTKGTSRRATFNMTYPVWDPQAGKYTDKNESKVIDFDNITPDQFMDQIYATILMQNDVNLQNQKLYNTNNQPQAVQRQSWDNIK
jgi:hypothetical protein